MGKRGGRGGKKGGKGNGRREKRSRDDSPKQVNAQGNYVSYPEIVTENALLKAYYKLHPNMIPEDEFDEFYATMKKSLPAAFRITGGKEKAGCLKRMIEEEYFPTLAHLEFDDETGQTYGQPKPMPWYPDGLAYYMDWPKSIIRKQPELKRFHQFLVNSDQVGSISRQEAVSMIPPVVLNVKKGHKVLDMCASPGSKTKQLIELVHGHEVNMTDSCATKDREFPDGLVVANDFDPRRCYLLVHQACALDSPCLVVTNHNGMTFPTMYNMRADGSGQDRSRPILFDRVLCDVPCSGDGTVRKNANVWQRWSPIDGPNQHYIQKKILFRGAEVLAVGGELVYSTCSMHPAEDEAVVCALLNKYPGAFELVDVSDRVPGLIHKNGITEWKIQGKVGKTWETFSKYSEVPEQLHNRLTKDMFAPDNVNDLHLERCVRLFPHLQNTGGFFVACLRKKLPLNTKDVEQVKQEEPSKLANIDEKSESDDKPNQLVKPDENVTEQVEKAKGNFGEKAVPFNKDTTLSKNQKEAYPNDPYYQIEPNSRALEAMFKFYKLDPNFPSDQLFHRKNPAEVSPYARFYSIVSKTLRDVLVANAQLRVVSAGIKIFERSRHNKQLARDGLHDYRVVQSGADHFAPYCNSRLIRFGFDNTKRLLSRHVCMKYEFKEGVEEQYADNSETGPCLVLFDPKANADDEQRSKTTSSLIISAFLSPTSITIMVNKQDAFSMLLLLVGPTEAHAVRDVLAEAAKKVAEAHSRRQMEEGSVPETTNTPSSTSTSTSTSTNAAGNTTNTLIDTNKRPLETEEVDVKEITTPTVE
eukprot:CFRG5034T1